MSDYFLGGEGRLTPSHAAVALVVVDREHYLMQLRDQKSGIFYPGHWGVFGGAIDAGETPQAALRREMIEETRLSPSDVRYFTEFSFDFSWAGFGTVRRTYFEVHVGTKDLASLVLGEGSDVKVFSARDVLNVPRVVPYDAFAIWMHASRQRAAD